EAVAALQVSTGLSPAMVEDALAAAFSELTESKLREYCVAEAIAERLEHAPQSVLHILPSNVFTAWLPGAAITLLLGAECVLKPSSREPVFAPMWKASLERCPGELGRRVRLIQWEE